VRAWTSENISIFENEQLIFNLSNGLLNVNTFELILHSPEWKLLTKSPVIYNPQAECPQFMEFMDNSLEPKYHQLIGEFIGYILWPEYHIHKAFMFLGPPRTGKGTMIRTTEAIVGKHDCSHVSLQDLTGNRFMRARLFGKKLNIYGDLPATPISDAGIFKNLTGEDTIDAENKFQHPFSFRNDAKLLFSANTVPSMKSRDDAFYNRWIIVPFGNSMLGKEDSDLTKKLTVHEELSGILNFVLEGLTRLKSNGWKFTYGDDAAALYRRKSNPIIAFLEDECEISADGYVIKTDLISAYNQYASKMELPPTTSGIAFGKAIADQTLIPVETFHPKVNDRQVEVWRGIRLKS
jgi:putative DNA primase/helicase